MTSLPTTVRAGDKLPVCAITISQELIDLYATLSGDFNPIHVDAQAGAAAGFGGTIAHGCIPMEPVFQAIQRWSGIEISFVCLNQRGERVVDGECELMA